MARILDSSETFPSTNLPDEESSVVSFGMFLYNFFCDYNLEPWLLLFLFLANMFLSFWLPTQGIADSKLQFRIQFGNTARNSAIRHYKTAIRQFGKVLKVHTLF
ncbi:hypothetical protein Fcan01_17665 [Folsomia candida]|uniref:Uncharacterized protein n=1 Tax=Folsomia candida TaxID=158441 RepID=A0A226DPR6_FOLCA|nr:hypothetical protein Fcan01_17665 [Folsomia candida]